MRILMVTSFLPHSRSTVGGALVMHAHLACLARRHDVTLASFTTGEDREAMNEIVSAGIRVLTCRRPQADAPTFLRRLRFAGSWLAGNVPLRTIAFRSHEMQSIIDRLTAEHRFDLLDVHDNAIGAYRFPRGIPSILTEQEVRAEMNVDGSSPTDFVRRREGRRWTSFQRRVWNRFDRLQVFTESDARTLCRIAPSMTARVRINPFGVDAPSRTAGVDETPGVVLFVGGFLHPPNIDAALWLAQGILPLVQRRLPGARLQLVGSSPPRAIQQLQRPDVEVTGYVHSLAPYLERAAVVVAPLRSGGGMRVKVLQAMAAGKAVVATPLATEGLHEFLPGAPPLRVAATTEAFAEEVTRLLESADDRHDLGRRAREFVTEFHTWDAYSRRFEAICEELVGTARDA